MVWGTEYKKMRPALVFVYWVPQAMFFHMAWGTMIKSYIHLLSRFSVLYGYPLLVKDSTNILLISMGCQGTSIYILLALQVWEEGALVHTESLGKNKFVYLV